MGQLDDWFRSWVPDSVFRAGGGRSSVEAWYTTALDIEERFFLGLLILMFTVLLLMLLSLSIRLIGCFGFGVEQFRFAWLVSSCLF